jgi:5-deoxy-glucuronate isomerase
MSDHLIRPQPGREALRVEPREIGWDCLGFSVMRLRAGEHLDLTITGSEAAIVPIGGSGVATVGDESYDLSRVGVFEQAGRLLYLPPDTAVRLTAGSDWQFAIGDAPAEGRYPARLITPEEVRVEVRGGGAAQRQVNHLLAPPLEAERLIVYEVLVPAGSWAGWPPHCHDGSHGSPYLEETYYFRFDRPEGFGFHRNYVDDRSLDESFAVHDGDCVAVPRGFHVTTPAPGSNMWILNFLAGDLIADERATPPYFDPAATWITEDWTAGQIDLPLTAGAEAAQ